MAAAATYYNLEGHNLRWEHIGRILEANKARAEFDGLTKAWPDRIFRLVEYKGAASKVIALYDPRDTCRPLNREA